MRAEGRGAGGRGVGSNSLLAQKMAAPGCQGPSEVWATQPGEGSSRGTRWVLPPPRCILTQPQGTGQPDTKSPEGISEHGLMYLKLFRKESFPLTSNTRVL